MGVKNLLKGAAASSETLIDIQKQMTPNNSEKKDYNDEVMKSNAKITHDYKKNNKKNISSNEKPKNEPNEILENIPQVAMNLDKKKETRGRKKTKTGEWTRFAIDIPTDLYNQIKNYAEENMGGNTTRAGAKLLKYALDELK